MKLKLPLPSNWFVSSRVQLECDVEMLVVPSRTKFALPTPPVPLKVRPLPEMEAERMTGVVVRITEIVPPVFREFVFHASPNGSAGSSTLEKVPLEAAAWNSLNVSPGTSCVPPMLVTMSVPPLVNAPKIFATELVNGALLISKMLVLPDASLSELLKVSVPSGLPGASDPPEFTVTAPEMVPLHIPNPILGNPGFCA